MIQISTKNSRKSKLHSHCWNIQQEIRERLTECGTMIGWPGEGLRTEPGSPQSTASKLNPTWPTLDRTSSPTATWLYFCENQTRTVSSAALNFTTNKNLWRKLSSTWLPPALPLSLPLPKVTFTFGVSGIIHPVLRSIYSSAQCALPT